MECQICYESGDLKCSSCFHPYCRNCLEQYFSTTMEPVCPNGTCPALWPITTLETFQPWYNGFQKYYLRYLWKLDQEQVQNKMQQLPDVAGKDRIQHHIEEAKQEIQTRTDILRRFEAMLNQSGGDSLEEQQKQQYIAIFYRKAVTEEKKYIEMLRRRIRYYTKELDGNNLEISNPAVYWGGCPANQCQGYILRATMLCNICANPLCLECHELKLYEHQCRPEAIESVKLIESDSKLCPQCHVVTHRYTGCAKMTCRQCGCGYDWRTLRILYPGNGIPQDRAPHDQPDAVPEPEVAHNCELPEEYELLKKSPIKLVLELEEVYQILQKCRKVLQTDHYAKLKQARLKMIQGKLSRERYQQTLYQETKQHQLLAQGLLNCQFIYETGIDKLTGVMANFNANSVKEFTSSMHQLCSLLAVS